MTGTGQPQGHAAERTIVALDEGAAFDLAVLGAGAGGMATAVFAALEGLKVILIERTEYLGGTTAYSGGTTWIPLTRHSAAVGAEDSRAAASRFLDLAVGNRAPKALREAFLDAGPEAVEVLETRTEMRFRARPFHPDYLSELEGATSFGRAIEPESYEAAGLGADFALIRPPIPEFTILGGLSVDRDDIAHLLEMTRSPKSAAYAARLFARYGLERLRWPRGTRLVMGNAMIGRLLASARKLGVVIATRAEVTALRMDDGRVAGIAVEQAGVAREIAVRRGVVLAGGGFARHPGMRAALLPAPVPEWSPSAPGHTGRLQELALGLGARQAATHDQPCFWAPVSVRKRKDGSTAVFPHFVFDRAKPGTVTVGRDGRRFVNESTSYHLFGKAMFEASRDGSAIPAFLIADAVAIKRYGLGMVRPGGWGLRRALADGYVVHRAGPSGSWRGGWGWMQTGWRPRSRR
jgi:glycine/D-amino acid oxidase-like deaminating enzyme